MKVNITGRGIIPGIGTIPPVYRREMSESAILKLLNFSNFRVYESSTGALITRKNVKTFFTTKSDNVEEKTDNITREENNVPSVETTQVETTPDDNIVHDTVQETTSEDVSAVVESIDEPVEYTKAASTEDENIDVTNDEESVDVSDEEVVDTVDDSTTDEVASDDDSTAPTQYSNRNRNKKNKKHH